MTLNCWVIDDEPLALSLLESYVSKTPFLKLTGKYSSAVPAMQDIAGQTVHLIFLDIQMPELNGMEFSRLLHSETRIIFTTAFSKYALEGYRVNALDYLLKPVSYAGFLEAANKALQWFEMAKRSDDEPKPTQTHEPEGLFVKSEYKLQHVRFKDILFMEGLKDYIKIFLANEPKPILTLMSLKSMEEALPPGLFTRVHRSYIIQNSKIDSISKNRIVICGHQIPIGDTYRENFRSLL